VFPAIHHLLAAFTTDCTVHTSTIKNSFTGALLALPNEEVVILSYSGHDRRRTVFQVCLLFLQLPFILFAHSVYQFDQLVF
jgi:hypothetical protein